MAAPRSKAKPSSRSSSRAVATPAPTVTHCGPYRREDVPELMADVDWVVVPSIWWENAPLVIQEAFQHTTARHRQQHRRHGRTGRDGVNGLGVSPNDPRALASAMRRIAEEPELRHRLSRNARRPDDIDTTARRYLELIEAIEPARVRAA